jgi:hypothetical protein
VTAGPQSTENSGNTGPTHGGFGHQFNGTIFYLGDGDRLLRRGRDPRSTARDHLVRLNKQFVEPPGYGAAWGLLADHGCAILMGEPGIGLRATGQVLLTRLGGPDATVQDESDIPDTPGESALDAGQVTEGDLVLLDPADAEDEHLSSIMRQLPSYQAELRKRGAYLVVVLTADRDHLLQSEVRPLVAAIERPSGFDVVRRHLQVADVPFTQEQLRSATDLRSHLEKDPIRELAKLVLLIDAARRRVGHSRGFDEWLDIALRELEGLGNEVAAEVRAHRSGPQRALLLATAMLGEAPADQVYVLADKLVTVTAQPEDERPALERDDLAQRLAELKIVVDPAGTVRFPTSSHAGAVRQHFWTNFPELRRNFRRWARLVAVSPEVGAQYRSEFVSHFAEQALRTNRPEDIVRLVDEWITSGTARSRALPAAAMALERGLGDRRHGSRYRQLIYSWSRDPQVTTAKAQLGIALSADVIASTHPSEALVRLHHFVRRQKDDVRATAEDALLELVRADRREFRRLVERVVTSLTGPRWDADFELFLTIARPDELTAALGARLVMDTSVREQLVLGWRVVMSERPTLFWAELAREWLSAVASGGPTAHWLDLLERAGAAPGPGSARLYFVAREWTREPEADAPARHRVALDLTNRMMRRARGTGPATGPRHRREEPAR